MIDILKIQLQEAKEERAKKVRPYDLRIKKLSAAIKSLEEFNSISDEINDADKDEVASIPKVEEAVEIEEKHQSEKF